ncbi:hypothetical protein AB0J13_10935 [Streptomyces anulatus]|uniref:hypothetical protein n=1 Tax=Streptomyces anulatus TaxID=1892 RepID=UPI0033CCD2EF
MTEKTPAELREQRARLIASTGLTETVLRERAEAHQLYPEHHDIWATIEGIDMHLAELTESGHVYLSTGCLHGEHAYCQSMTGQQGEKRPGRCKFCDALCTCPCHGEKEGTA